MVSRCGLIAGVRRSPAIANVVFSSIVAGVVNKIFMEAFGVDVIDHANCGGVEMSARIVNIVLGNYLT